MKKQYLIFIATLFLMALFLASVSASGYNFFVFNPSSIERTALEEIPSPIIKSVSVYPDKVMPGQVLLITAEVESMYSIKSAVATFPNEKQEDEMNMLLISGTKYKGVWEARWISHDTKAQAYYNTTVIFTNILGKKSQAVVAWQDPTVTHKPSDIVAGNFTAPWFNFNDTLHINLSSGNVGIGTTEPGQKLDVVGNIQGGDGTIKNVLGYSGALNAGLIGTISNHPFVIRVNNDNSKSIYLDTSGNVGIGTTGPQSILHITKGNQPMIMLQSYDIGASDIGLKLAGTHRVWRIGSNMGGVGINTFNIRDDTSDADRLVIDVYGNVGIGTTSPLATLDVRGTGNFSGNLYAGSCTGTGKLCTDIAELFPVEKEVSEGDVVCLKENGKAGLCEKEFDSSVLGVISTNPAIIISGNSIILGRGNYSDTDDKLPIALKGKVPVKVDCKTPIKQGDLLVSSAKKGYAMKKNLSGLSIEEKISRIEGTTLGKALEECKKGHSIIMAWVG